MIKLLEFLSGFDWTLLFRFFIERLYYGPGAVFYVPIAGVWSGHQIRKLLKKYGIPLWGWGFAFGRLYFRVPIKDAPAAQEIMLAAGVDLMPF